MLKIENLRYNTGKFSLNNINLTVKEGECHIVMGSSGSGKTTLLETILGLKHLTSGKIFLHEKEITNLPSHKRQIAYVPQDLALFPHMNVIENICYGAKISNSLDKNFIDHIIKTMDLGKILTNEINNTSGGEKKRIALARALSIKPKLILLDEPLANLDKAIAEELQFFIKKIQQEFNLTLLYVTHDFDEAFFMGDIISVLLDGKLIQTSKKQELYFYPRTISLVNFLGIKNIFKAFYKGDLDEEYEVFIPEFNATFKVKKRPRFPEFQRDKPIYVGIRSDEVMYIRKDRTKGFNDNILKGVITEIHRLETMSKILFKVKDRIIEIDMPYGVLRKLGLTVGMDGEVMFKKEAIFIADFD